jgi:hypothetical protein
VTILEAIQNEQRKLTKEVGKVRRELNGIRAAAKALGGSVGKKCQEPTFEIENLDLLQTLLPEPSRPNRRADGE